MFQGQMETALLWSLPSTSGCLFYLNLPNTRLTLEKVPVTVRKDPLTTGKVLLTVGKTTTLEPFEGT